MEERSKISILVPTRKRPARLEEFLDSVFRNSTFPNRIEIVLGVDDDDAESVSFEYDKLNIIKTISPRCGMGELNSRCLSKSTGGIIILANDDIVVKTKCWDEKIDELHELYEDKIYLGYFDDGLKGKSLCTFPILSRTTTELLQTPFSSDYKGSLIDLELMEIFQRLKGMGKARIHYLKGVQFEHQHFQLIPGVWDSTYAERDRFSDDIPYYNNLKVRIEKSRKLYLGAERKLKNSKPMLQSSDTTFFKFFVVLLFDLKLPIFFKARHILHMSLRFIYRTIVHRWLGSS
jgi:hypothetical protein